MSYKLSLIDQFAILLRRSPLRTIKRLLRKAEQYQIELDARRLESHHLGSGDISDLVAALVFCKENGLQLEPVRAMTQQYILREGGMTLLDQMNALAELGIRDIDSYLDQRLQRQTDIE